MQFQPQYPELFDVDWLKHKYHEEGLSSKQIAATLGCSGSAVILALRRNNITIRDGSAARKLVPLKSYRYPLLNNRDWLYQKYALEGLSTIQITNLAGARTANSARQALMRFGIPVRNYREGQTHKLEDDGLVLDERTLQIIEGGLLGDATMRKWSKTSNLSAPMFVRHNKYRDHVLYVCRELRLQDERVTETESKCRGKRFVYYRFNTFSHDSLTPIYQRWYPAENEYKKLVPEDFVLTPISLLHWFMDDGCAELRKRKDYKPHWHRKPQVRITLCSESFTKEENEFLISQLANLGLRASVYRISEKKKNRGKGYRISIHQSQAQHFYDVIGPCPVQSLAYKWKLPN